MGSSSSKPSRKSSSSKKAPVVDEKASTSYKVKFTSQSRNEFNDKLIEQMLAIPMDKRLKFVDELTLDEVSRKYITLWLSYQSEAKQKELRNSLIRDLLENGRKSKHKGGFMVTLNEAGDIQIKEMEVLPSYSCEV